jgi:serine/threonine protein kinase
MSSLITLLGMGSKQSDEEDLINDPDHCPLAVSRSGLRAGFTHANDSNATTLVNPLRLRLTGAETQEPLTPHSAPLSPRFENEAEFGSSSPSPTPNTVLRRHELRRSQSTPGLHFMISRKLNQAFGSPTIVKKSELRSRPSIQTLNPPIQSTIGPHQSSSPSVHSRWSTFSPQDGQKSTPATSDGPIVSPSVFHHDSILLEENDRVINFSHDLTNQPRLTPIPEGAVLPGLSIKTVEATATAKIFLETHFNTFLNTPDTRKLRRFELEKRLVELQLPLTIRDHAIDEWERKESETLRLLRVFMSVEVSRKKTKSLAVGKYEVVKVLGKGSFGVVRLVKQKVLPKLARRIVSPADIIRQVSQNLVRTPSRDNMPSSSILRRDLNRMKKDVYAMKVIRKSDMLRNSQEGHLRAERDFLVAAEGSKWIIPLFEAFQDSSFLYLVMDFCIGGDFLGLLIRKNTLSEEITKWYVAEMILCIEEAHRMKWIHRDVKPDNFLIGADGHLKISDFGLAFDGEWDHDQKFYHKHRHDLLEKLGIEIQGDEQDLQEQTDVENSRRLAQVVPQSNKPAKQTPPKDEPPPDEPVLDWRNRTQRRRLARSVVGTSQYMAPEVIRGDLYDGRCD